MNKGIAIQTVLLLLIGILVAGVLIYFVYVSTKSSTITESECMSRVNSLCLHCQTNDWGDWPNTGDPINEVFYQPLWDCAEKFPKYAVFAKDANPWSCTRMEEPCKMFGY